MGGEGYKTHESSLAMARAMAAKLVEATAPKKVILFGSRARGDFGPSSDFDFMVVEPTAPGMDDFATRYNTVYRALAPFHVGHDVVVVSEAAFEKRKDWLAHVIAKAHREGRVLYERPA